MKPARNNDSQMSLMEQPGRAALDKYLAHKGGIELFRAYIERREHDRKRTQERKSNLLQRMESGLPTAEWDEISSEFLHYRILEELDAVIGDLLRYCEKPPSGKDDQLVNLRSALRIGKNHSPYDAKLAETRWLCEQGWIDAFLRIAETGKFESQASIAKRLAATFGISKSAAITYWRGKSEREPWQARWAKEITDRAKLAQRRIAPSGQKSFLSTTRTKPKSWR